MQGGMGQQNPMARQSLRMGGQNPLMRGPGMPAMGRQMGFPAQMGSAQMPGGQSIPGLMTPQVQDGGMNPAMFQTKPAMMPNSFAMGGNRPGIQEGQIAENGSMVIRDANGNLGYAQPGYGMGPDTGNFMNDYRDGSGTFIPRIEGGVNTINHRVFNGQGLSSGGIDFANMVRQYMPQYAGMFGSMGSAQAPQNPLARNGGTGIPGMLPSANPYRLK